MAPPALSGSAWPGFYDTATGRRRPPIGLPWPRFRLPTTKDHRHDRTDRQGTVVGGGPGNRCPDGNPGPAIPPEKFPSKSCFTCRWPGPLFQLWYASPLPFIFNIGIFNSTEARSIHLAFAIFLAYTAYPTFKKSSPRNYIPIQDWVVGPGGGRLRGLSVHLLWPNFPIGPGNPTQFDLVVGVIGLILLLEATRRALGPPLMVVAAVFMVYTFFGSHMPDVISHKGASLSKGMSHYWLSTEGVFGVAVGVSTEMVFMFVLFGALLEQAGAGNYFIRAAFAGLGHLRGGPAKAAVVASGLTGLVSGSSIANVVTTGTFTIPLMKKVGFSPEKAGGGGGGLFHQRPAHAAGDGGPRPF